MTARLAFHDEVFLLDHAGALIWPRLSLMAVADLHLEKGSACARRGQLVPPLDSQVTLARLQNLVARYAPDKIVAVGDSFHDDGAASRLSAADFALLKNIAGAAQMVWVSGNHDPSPPCNLPGECVKSYSAGKIVFRHQAQSGARGEISGHYHPKARVVTRAGEIVRPCFMAGRTKIILPAFGAYTGGLDISAPAISTLFPEGGEAFLLGREKLFRFAVKPPAPAALAPSPPAHNFA